MVQIEYGGRKMLHEKDKVPKAERQKHSTQQDVGELGRKKLSLLDNLGFFFFLATYKTSSVMASGVGSDVTPSVQIVVLAALKTMSIPCK